MQERIPNANLDTCGPHPPRHWKGDHIKKEEGRETFTCVPQTPPTRLTYSCVESNIHWYWYEIRGGSLVTRLLAPSCREGYSEFTHPSLRLLFHVRSPYNITRYMVCILPSRISGALCRGWRPPESFPCMSENREREREVINYFSLGYDDGWTRDRWTKGWDWELGYPHTKTWTNPFLFVHVWFRNRPPSRLQIAAMMWKKTFISSASNVGAPRSLAKLRSRKCLLDAHLPQFPNFNIDGAKNKQQAYNNKYRNTKK